MADFSPFGFNWQYSQTVSANALSPIVEYPWNPAISGYTGDMAVAFVCDAAGRIASDYAGYVYPAPITIASNGSQPPIVGVIVGFKYQQATSLQNPLNGIDIATFFNPSVTPIPSGGTVSVLINTDPAAIYSVQTFNTTSTTEGVRQNKLFYYAKLKADSTYDVTVGTTNPLVWTFGYGNNTTGYSLQYLDASSLAEPITGTPNPSTYREYLLQVVGVTEGGNNDWATNTDLQSNNLVNIRCNMNVIGHKDYSLSS